MLLAVRQGLSFRRSDAADRRQVKPGPPFILAVISGTQKMDSKKMKKVAKAKSLRFASEEEVWKAISAQFSMQSTVRGPPFSSLTEQQLS